ncbi:glucose 1-dehydrogenase [Acetobacteraceae bacterium KSS8]|uniref:Glucose 1-dehydrogenase n=1 Tax=Endosaccharibacter trunci TaxID=2812733 RepID=A0ABT1W7Z6_9PROT|nr:glucose 1-dehydrogenase [Acetobacteraceae bacterium KSS8]
MSVLNGKIALVTGASKGIGAGIALALAEAGAGVVVNYGSSRDGADKVVAEIVSKGGEAIAVQGDVSKPAELSTLFDTARQRFGRLDILVNNAGVFAPTPLESLTEQEYRRQFDINVLGLLLASQAAAAAFGQGGSIVNVGSVVSRTHPPGMVVYNATKGAVDAITRTLAKDLGGRGIRVNSVNPGATDTEGARAMFAGNEQAFDGMVAVTPLGRMGLPRDIARAVVFLASDDAAWITGETLAVSGGM